MSKIEYLIVPKGTKFTTSGKLGLKFVSLMLYVHVKVDKQINITTAVLTLHPGPGTLCFYKLINTICETYKR